MKPHVLAREDQKLEVEPEVAGKDGSSACLEEEMNNISSLGSAGSSSDNCIQMEETNDKIISFIHRALLSENMTHILNQILS